MVRWEGSGLLHRCSRPVVEVEAEQFGPRVMADRIHHPLALGDEAHTSRSAIRMPSPEVSGGTTWLPSGETIAVMQPPVSALRSFSSGEMRAICSSVSQPVEVDHEAARFQRVVADRHLDLLGEDRSHQRAGELRDVDLLVLRHQRVAGEGIVVLPAGQRADPADGGVDRLQAGAVALAPDHPLVEGRGDLAALEQQAAVGVEDELGVVERAVVALVHPEHDHHAEAAGRGADGAPVTGPGTTTALS